MKVGCKALAVVVSGAVVASVAAIAVSVGYADSGGIDDMDAPAVVRGPRDGIVRGPYAVPEAIAVKTDAETGGQPQGGANGFNGMRVMVEYVFNGAWECYPYSAEAVFEADENGVVAFADAEPVKGTWPYKVDGRNVIPEGIVYVNEVAAPAGYATEGIVHVGRSSEGVFSFGGTMDSDKWLYDRLIDLFVALRNGEISLDEFNWTCMRHISVLGFHGHAPAATGNRTYDGAAMAWYRYLSGQIEFEEALVEVEEALNIEEGAAVSP